MTKGVRVHGRLILPIRGELVIVAVTNLVLKGQGDAEQKVRFGGWRAHRAQKKAAKC